MSPIYIGGTATARDRIVDTVTRAIRRVRKALT